VTSPLIRGRQAFQLSVASFSYQERILVRFGERIEKNLIFIYFHLEYISFIFATILSISSLEYGNNEPSIYALNNL
jgi:hypothetical protein